MEVRRECGDRKGCRGRGEGWGEWRSIIGIKLSKAGEVDEKSVKRKLKEIIE